MANKRPCFAAPVQRVYLGEIRNHPRHQCLRHFFQGVQFPPPPFFEEPWGHCARLKLRCDFACIVGITGFDLF
jgi:hypothetical protein